MNSDLAYSLMMKADAARRRLADLESQEKVPSRRSADAMKIALRELSDVLEELRVATEQLHAALDDVAVARQEAVSFEARYRELHEGLPSACLLTNEEGCVDQANTRAATLLNVARQYLPGKPLFLFLPERDRYFDLVEKLRKTGAASGHLTLRPREQKPRQVTVDVAVLPSQMRWCWLISELS